MPAVNPLMTALSGLKVAQTQIAVASNNIANASTEGYTRKTVQQYSLVIGNEGVGVDTGTVQRHIDAILLRDYRTQISSSSNYGTTQKYLNQVQNFHGSPDSETALSSYIGRLQNAFSELSNEPENQYALNNVYSSAKQVVDKFSSASAMLTTLRNGAQDEMVQSITQINQLTTEIAQLNVSIKAGTAVGRSTADLEDKRDQAIKSLASEMDVTYYTDAENVTTVMTRSGQTLADTGPRTIYFSKAALGPANYYPASAGAVMLDDPLTGSDLTADTSLGGRLGALVKLRDQTLPTYQAQLDETAHKMALRFDAEGLKLFTNPDGTIPANTPSSYVGFSASMVINPAVTQDKSLIVKGTGASSTVQSGSSEVLRKVVQFAFGDIQYEQGLGNVDISNAVPTLFTTLGISGQSRVVGTKNVQSLTTLDSSPLIIPGTNDTLTLQVGAAPAQTITITAGMTASGLVTAINAAYPGMAQLGAGGQLVLTTANDLTIGAGTLGASGLAELGLTAGTTTATPPSFTVAVGNNDPVTIQIASTDTSTQLLNKLNAVAGVTATLTADGYLKIVPTEGGDISLVDGTGKPLAALGMVVSNVAHTAFNVANLGAGSNLDGGVQSATGVQNYMAQAISLQSQDAALASSSYTTEDSYRATLEKEYTDETGVNIDEEMARLINIQTAYSASARAISIAQQMLDELMNTFVR